MIRTLISIIVLSIVLCLILWKHLNLPVCIGIVSGSSMEPTLSPGSIVIGFRGEPRIGSIVVFNRNGSLVIHRVININSTHIVTKGDACIENDPPISIKDVLCVVSYYVKGDVVILAIVIGTCVSFWLITLGNNHKYTKTKLKTRGYN
ncbi:MAG: S26 family signal peptidase [Ignisphaera sp.]